MRNKKVIIIISIVVIAILICLFVYSNTGLKGLEKQVDNIILPENVDKIALKSKIGNEGVLALLSDSTNAERKGFTMSESSVGAVFDKLFVNCTKRIVIATFSSNVHRVQQIVNSAVKYGRKIAICGRSMQNMIEAAREFGDLDLERADVNGK